MKNTRPALKAFAVTLATTVMVLASLSAPAQAKDTGWGVKGGGGSGVTAAKDTGWG